MRGWHKNLTIPRGQARSVIAEVGQAPLGTPWPAQPVNLLRKNFSLAKTVRSARIYSTALGTYQLYLNGQRVGNDILAPGWTDYRKRIVYQVYDVTSQVRSGANAIGAILGGGWYADGLGWLQTRYNFGPPPVRLLVQLEVEYTDGTRDSVVSDESWKATQSPILASEIYNGENYDARLEQKGWDQPSFSDARWGAVVAAAVPPAPLVAQDFQPIRINETLKPKTVTNPKPGVYRLRSRPEHGRLGAAARCGQGGCQGSNPLWRSSQAKRRALYRKFADGRSYRFIHFAWKGT